MIDDVQFWNGIWITFYLYALSLAMQLVLGTGLALLLFRAKRLPGILRSLFISPFLLPPVVAGMMWLVILDPSLGAAKLDSDLTWPAAVRLAGLSDDGGADACHNRHMAMDPLCRAYCAGGGCNRCRHPSMKPPKSMARRGGRYSSGSRYHCCCPHWSPRWCCALSICCVFFDLIYITTQGGPSNHSMTLNIYGFRQGFEFFQLGYASALMVTLSVMVLGAVIALNRLRAGVEW